MASKIAVLRINPRELLAIKNSLEAIASVKNILSNSENPYLQAFGEKLYGCEELVLKITQSINLEAPAILSKGNFIAENFNQELDELRKLAYGGKDYLEKL